MQRLPLDCKRRLAHTVFRISDQRMTDMRHMHPDLMRASGEQCAFHKRIVPKAFQNLEFRRC